MAETKAQKAARLAAEAKEVAHSIELIKTEEAKWISEGRLPEGHHLGIDMDGNLAPLKNEPGVVYDNEGLHWLGTTAPEARLAAEAVAMEAAEAKEKAAEAPVVDGAVATNKIADIGITAEKIGVAEAVVSEMTGVHEALTGVSEAAPEGESMTSPAQAEPHDTNAVGPNPDANQVPQLSGVAIGRVVHYVLKDGDKAGEHRAALISRVVNDETGLVDLTVFFQGPFDGRRLDNSTEYVPMVNHDREQSKGTWHFPERV